MALMPGVVAHTTHPPAQTLRKEETMSLKSVWTAQQDAVWEIKARGGRDYSSRGLVKPLWSYLYELVRMT